MSLSRQRERGRGLQWAIVKHHYRARRDFMVIFRVYESRVAHLVKERSTKREEIRLNAPETRLLFDTPQLEALLQDEVQPLREASHAYFRDSDIAEPYDTKISRVYHELSILKEEHLSVRDWPEDGGSREFSRLFREVSEYYPQRLRRVRDLFQRASRRLETLLPRFSDNPVVLRSVFLFRDELWGDQARAGVTRFLNAMFVDAGSAAGFLDIALSFFKAGFFDEALQAVRMGIGVTKKATVSKEVREALDRLAERAGKEFEALKELDA